MIDFVNLSVRTSFSVLQALSTPKEVFNRAKELEQKSVAITEYYTLSSVWNNYKLYKETGIKYIPGCDFAFTDNNENKSEKLRHIILLAKNAQGYKNLLTLHRDGFDHSSLILKKVVPVIDWKLIEKYKEGLICLTGCANGIIGQLINTKRFDDAEHTFKKLIELFGSDLGAEIQAHNLISNATTYRGPVNQIFTNSQIIKMAQKYNVKIIPTSFSHYTLQGEHEINDVLQAIGSMQPVYSNNRLKFDTKDLYLKSGDEIKTFFSRNYGEEFAEIICKNTVEFAEKCENPDWVDPKFSNPSGKELPIFPVKDEPDYQDFLQWLESQDDKIKNLSVGSSYLRFKCLSSFENDLKTKILSDQIPDYIKRIENELYVLDHQGFSDYLLIVADYISWARNNKITVGVGRGSCGASLCANLLGIHKADPIKYGLIFERFQNIQKRSFPDIDLDFTSEGKDKVIQYIIKKYGKDRTAYISNLNRIKPKVYARDISRTCQTGGSREEAIRIGNAISEIFPKEIDGKKISDITEFEVLQKSILFSEYVKRYSELYKYRKILGKFKALSTHAGGQVIGRRSLIGLVPIRVDKDNYQSLEYDKDNAEENGLLKVDILGLSTLDIIDLTIKLINKTNKDFKLENIKFEEYDQKTYDLISQGNTLGVFQFGSSSSTIDLCKRIRPKCMEDLALITALARPAAANIRNEFIQTRNGKKPFSLLHPSLKSAFQNTFGYGLYDESILQLGSDVAGWDLNEADRIRKMIKEKGKHPEKEAKLREDFISGAIKNGIQEKIAIKIWEVEVSKFKGYTFNKSHAILYSFTSFITAYLKAHYSLEFLLANLTFELASGAPDAEENAAEIKNELKKLGHKILPPNINYSKLSYDIQGENMLRTGFEAIKQVGDDAIEEIITKRPFISFDDFMFRTTSKKVRANAIQALVAVGALDDFKLPRKLMFLYASDYRKKLQIWLKKHDPKTEKFSYQWPEIKEWSIPELYALEYKYMGEAFVADKRQAYGAFFTDAYSKSIPLKAVKKMPDRDFLHSIKGEIKSIFEMKVKKETSRYVGQEMLKCTIEDEFGEQISLTLFPETYKRAQSRIKSLFGNKYKIDIGLAIHFNGSVNIYGDETGIVMNELFSAAPTPLPPKDLKAKSIASSRSSKKSITIKQDVKEIVENLEDELFEQGFIDLNVESEQEENDRDIYIK